MSDTHTMTQNSNGERDIFKIVMGGFMTLITAAILYVASQLVTTQVALAEINRDVLNISVDVAEMREASRVLSASLYTATQATSDARLQAAVDARQDAELNRFKEWTTRLSDRLASYEQAAN